MAVPKRKHSKARSRKRRSVYYNALEAPQMMECPNCGDPKVMHHACQSCGHYRGRKVVEPKETPLDY
jgi:large subunit ribosomal protein L32